MAQYWLAGFVTAIVAGGIGWYVGDSVQAGRIAATTAKGIAMEKEVEKQIAASKYWNARLAGQSPEPPEGVEP